MRLKRDDINKLVDAIEQLYYFEFVVDDLPVRGFIGQYEEQVRASVTLSLPIDVPTLLCAPLLICLCTFFQLLRTVALAHTHADAPTEPNV